ncbi:MAG TPA: HDOD domain-containing protein [Terriglobales bacterium]|nr:HDOD domain-containing protein [Terriglobales bacterium]
MKPPIAQGGSASVFHTEVILLPMILSARNKPVIPPLKSRRSRADRQEVKPAAATKKTLAPNAPPLAGQRFIARQPILDRGQKVYGYELLFRNGVEDYFNSDPEVASRSTLDTSLLLGIGTLCDNRRAFVNCTREILFKDLITLLPPSQAVAEILETVEPEDRVVAACKRLKAAGYLIALDDFAPNDPRLPLVEYADIIKVDIRATRPEERAGMMRRFASPKCKMLAEKLETPHEFYQARDMGFVYFQGYFFCRPELIVGREVPANRLHYVRLLEMVSRQEIDMRELEKMLKQEASICYRLLRYLNSPVFGFSLEIKSVRHALAVLGEREMRRWIRLVVAVGAADQKCSELVLMGLARARFCELLSVRLQTNTDLFLMGLLSIMDALLEVGMEVLLGQLPVDNETKAVLLGQNSSLRPLYQLMLAQESGEWEQSTKLAAELKIPTDEVASVWWQAMQWAQEATSGI